MEKERSDTSALDTIESELKAPMYIIGNPLIAMTMLKHEVAAGLNVPVRIMIYEDVGSGTTRFVRTDR